MKSVIVIYIIVVTCGLTHSYSAYGNAKRRSNMIAPMMPIYSQVSPQYYDSRAATNSYIQSQPQYLNVPYIQQQQQQQQQRILDDYNNNNNYRSNPNYYYYPQEREQYQEPLYGIPTYHGDYNPKPYYFAQPSYMSQDDRLEATNPLDYLHEEILQENERERNNAAFMQNLQLYNKQIDSLQGRQQQLQQIQDMYNLKSTNEFDDYDIEQPNDWYDQTSILVEPNAYDSYIPQQQEPQYLPQRSLDSDDEMVKELKNLKQNRNSKSIKQQFYNNRDWQQDMPSSQDADEDVREPENYDEDEWINWAGQKRSIQPKKDFADGKQLPEQTTVGKQSKVASKATATVTTSKPSSPKSTTTTTTTTESSKILGKLHKGGQKEIFLPRPSLPVRRPFSESIMKSLGQGAENKDQAAASPPPIYKTIKQIIDMEQSLSHLSDNQLPTSKIRKRFVTNEEALAQQLNGLKRTSK
ncbi:hypothetical protein PVAND_005393 [Polypedilum vanderplanki]|uniref:Uncharacterized protein n=1 Tax=Polypedilum vanderplanki TaxID=319348 RepID=A0A9J6BZU8_POLVA|nr:hypothetical protein PVAND_005393 [Polypedilum vanderplanki]